MEDKVESKSIDDTNTVEQEGTDNNAPVGNEGGEKDAAPGFMGKMKDFYEKADSMAASNALLLNKELEDRGVVEKRTDETGLMNGYWQRCCFKVAGEERRVILSINLSLICTYHDQSIDSCSAICKSI